MRFLIKFSYDGSNYYGFQRQPNKKTIQQELEDVLYSINNNRETPVVATGRTDKKVHATCQYMHTDINVKINENQLKRAMNTKLPNDIHIIEVKKVDDNFHARYDIVSKEYKYYINMNEYNPLERNYVFQYNHKLNVGKMKKAIKYFKGTHDFRAFVTENKDKKNCVRTINTAKILSNKGKLTIIFRGTGFLRYQVRNMVGILIRVGEEKLEPKEVKNILLSKDRSNSGKTAPAEGLYLTDVKYH